jgi:hypothetical protein
MTATVTAKVVSKSRKPGFLLEPLGWVQDRLSKAIEAEPRLLELLFGLDQSRMHLMGLALAHLAKDVTPDLALMLLQSPKNAILDLSIGHRPVGIDRVLRRLPRKVLGVEIYRKLVDLLNYSSTARFLHHIVFINERIIVGLHRLPAVLRRPAIMTMFDRIGGMVWFVDALRFLASRLDVPFDVLAEQVGALNQPDQVAAKIRQLVDSLPLPDTLPPAEIGTFRRVDCVTEVRELAKQWQNCLADYVLNINDGTSAVYLSEQLQAVSFLVRQGRMGWLLLQTKGPKNIDIEPDQLAEIHDAFAAAGIPEATIRDPINRIIQTYQWLREVDD